MKTIMKTKIYILKLEYLLAQSAPGIQQSGMNLEIVSAGIALRKLAKTNPTIVMITAAINPIIILLL